MKPGRDFLEVVGDKHDGGSGVVAGQFAEAVHQILASAQVQPGGRLVQQQQFGVGHERAGDLDALALTLGQRGERPVQQRTHSPVVQQAESTAFVVLLVPFAPAARDSVGGRDDDIEHFLVLGDLGGQGGGGQADPGPQFEDVHGAENFLQDPGLAARRVEPGGRNLEQSGLASAVGSEDHPALAFPDLPVDLAQERFGSADNADGGHFKNITHRSRH